MASSGPDSDSVEPSEERPATADREHGHDRDADRTGAGASATERAGDEAAVEREDGSEDEDEDGTEWQFALDDVGPDGIVESEPEPLEPGRPTLENTVFVLLGVVGTLLLLSTVI